MRTLRLWNWELRLARTDEWYQSVDMEIDFAGFLTSHVREILEKHGCTHGHDLSGTPPMMYPEAICCALHFQRSEGRREALEKNASHAARGDGGGT